ncbi:GNAT family N-acetyltransferase [Paenibacillus sp. FSL R7-0333]|uniref:GNAT family N-acetyltransferase n=1 Tax=Paenibacillus sp. FSL R7-0333 TaxID=1926587 RepID=UPI0009F9FEA8
MLNIALGTKRGGYSMYTCRKANFEDLSKICDFPISEEEVFFMSPKLQYPLTVDHFNEVIKDRMNQTTIEYNGEICGFASVYNVENNNKCWLGTVIVSPSFRNKGAAEFLVKDIIRVVEKELSIKELHLVCHNINTRGLMFYSRLGFTPYEIEKRITPSGEIFAAIKMKLELG